MRIKRINSHVGFSRFLAECEDTGLVIDRQNDIPSPYAYSPIHGLSRWEGKLVFTVETAHKQYDVFTVPPNVIPRTLAEQEAIEEELSRRFREEQRERMEV